jgi:outer membrane protein assembly factor BamB
MPTVSRGRLFLFDAVGKQARLRCLNSETGARLWEFSYPFEYEDLYGYDNGPRAFPVVDDERVYLFGVDGQLHCLQVTDGQVLWQIDTQKKFGVVQNFFGVGSTPIIEGELLIVPVGGSPAAEQELPPGRLDLVHGNGTGVVAFDKCTGEVKYTTSDELASYASPVMATIGQRRWGFVFARGGLLGFDPASGKVDFHYPWRAKILESVNASNPVVVDDTVFISECYGPGSSLLRVKPGGYDVVWADGERRREKSMQTHWNTPVYHEGYLYGSSGRHSGEAELRCIEFATGKIEWSQPDLARSSLLYVDGHFLCLGEYGQIHVLRVNPAKFDLVETWELLERPVNRSLFGAEPLIRYPAWAAPVLSHGLLYVRGRSRLVCLELIPERT